MIITTRKLVQIAAWGGLIVSGTGFYLQQKFVDKIRGYDYYRNAIKILRTNAGAVYYLGEPIKDKRFKITDTENNFFDSKTARFSIPVSGPKDRGHYYIWVAREDNEWKISRAELELKSKPDARMNPMFEGTSKERFFYHNTLLCLAKALQGKNITVDLRNDTYVCGQLDSVDGYMNMTFSKTVYCDPQGNEFLFDNLFIQARNVRHVHIPESASILSMIKNELYRSKKPRSDKKPVDTRKAKKAYKQHLDIVASLNK